MLRISSRDLVPWVVVLITAWGLSMTACGDSTSEMTTGGSGGTPTSGGSVASSGGAASSGGVVSSGGTTAPAGTVATGGSATMPDAGETSDTGTLVSFSKQIFPILEANCVRCHGPSRQNSGVRVESYTEVKSRLSMVTHALVDGLMPPSGALPLANRQLFQAWVDEGALDN